MMLLSYLSLIIEIETSVACYVPNEKALTVGLLDLHSGQCEALLAAAECIWIVFDDYILIASFKLTNVSLASSSP